MASVTLENLYKTFVGQSSAETPVLRRINLTIADGEFMVLVGPSGCGKSTLLRLIAGLESASAGQMWVGGQRINDLAPKQRDIAMVFQGYALYPHLTVYDNLAFGLRRMPAAEAGEPSGNRWWENLLRGVTRPLPPGLRYVSEAERAIGERVQAVAKMLQIDALLSRYPRQLSGGQKQRVALGRAMARNPQVFLMDEPLSNLDAQLRTDTRAQIVDLQRQLGITTIYVTHDQVEAMTMGDRIAVMNQGQIQQVAAPLELYHHPANRFVAQFIGSPKMNFLTVQVPSANAITHSGFRLSLPPEWDGYVAPHVGGSLVLGIRPEHLSLGLPAPKNLAGRVVHLEALGSETYLQVQSESELLRVKVPPERAVALGDEVWVAIATERLHLFDPDTEVSLKASPAMAKAIQ